MYFLLSKLLPRNDLITFVLTNGVVLNVEAFSVSTYMNLL